mgnify:CR=1 FL=1
MVIRLPFGMTFGMVIVRLKLFFGDLLSICQQHDDTVSHVWDGAELKLTFRRCVDAQLISRWFDLTDCIKRVAFTSKDDAPIWLL